MLKPVGEVDSQDAQIHDTFYISLQVEILKLCLTHWLSKLHSLLYIMNKGQIVKKGVHNTYYVKWKGSDMPQCMCNKE